MRGGALLISILAVLGFAARAEAAAPGANCKFTKFGELPVVMIGLRPVVTTTINGQEARFILDSGAFYSSLTEAGAAKLGLKLRAAPQGMRVTGIGGSREPQATIAKEFALGGAKVRDVDFVILGDGSSYGETVGLLGQNILSVFDVEYDLAHGVVRLFRPEGCGDLALAYWVEAGQAFSTLRLAAPEYRLDLRISAMAKLNGDDIRAQFDTGAPRSLISRDVAAHAGVTPESATAVSAGGVGGIGPRTIDTWISPFKSFALGVEEIRNPRLRFGDMGEVRTEMLIGADFFVSHRVLVSNSQRKMYFTYNGGPVFNLDRVGQMASITPAATAAEAGDAPTDAAGFHRRGAVLATRQDYKGAIEAFSRAIALSPEDAELYFERGGAYLGDGQGKLGRADVDKSIALKPDFVDALIRRGTIALIDKDEAKAKLNFDLAVRASKSDSAALMVAGLEEETGLYADAIAHYDRWLAAHPKGDERGQALNSRCWARATHGEELDKALADCDAALKLLPRTSNILDSRGMVRLRMKQYDASIADYDAALKLQPKGVWSLYGRGLAKTGKGLKAEGEADMKAAVALEAGVVDEAKRWGLQP